MFQILACAALEGITFTLAALAYAFDCDPAVLELQLDCLLDDPDYPDELGLLVDAGPRVIDWPLAKLHRELVRYRFNPWLAGMYFRNITPFRRIELVAWPMGWSAPVTPSLTRLRLSPTGCTPSPANRPKEAAQFHRLLHPRCPDDALLSQIDILQTLLADYPAAVWRLLALMAELYRSSYMQNEPRSK